MDEESKKDIYVEYVDEDLEEWFDEHRDEAAIKEYINNIDVSNKIEKIYSKVSSKRNYQKKAKEERITDRIERTRDIEELGNRSLVDDKDKKKDEKKKEVKDEAKEEVQEVFNNMDSMIRYKMALDDLHITLMESYKRQISERDLTPSDDDFIKIVELRKELEDARRAYQSEYKDDELKYENDLIAEEEELDRQLKTSFKKEILDVQEIQDKLDDVIFEIEKLNYRMKHDEASREEYERNYDRLSKQRVELSFELSRKDPKILEQMENRDIENDEYERKQRGNPSKELEETEVMTINNEGEKKATDQVYSSSNMEVNNQRNSREEKKRELQQDEEEVVNKVLTEMEINLDEEETLNAAQNMKFIEEKVRDITVSESTSIDNKDVGTGGKIDKTTYGEMRKPVQEKEETRNIAEDVADELIQKAVEDEYAKFTEESIEEEAELGLEGQTKDEQHEAFIQSIQCLVVDVKGSVEAALEYSNTIKEIDEQYRKASERREKISAKMAERD